jgi:hypothetical protein
MEEESVVEKSAVVLVVPRVRSEVMDDESSERESSTSVRAP